MATFPLLLSEAGKIVVWSLPWDLVGLLEIILTKLCESLWNWAPGVFNSQAYPHWASISSSVTVNRFYQYWLQLWASAPGLSVPSNSCDSLSLPLSFSSFQGSSLPCDIHSLMYLRRVIDFQFVQQFFSSGDWSDDFQALHMWDWKPEVSALHI